MATEVTIQANRYNEYWGDIRVQGVPLQAQIDTAMTQESCEVGLSLTQADFERVSSAADRLVQLYTLHSPDSTPVRTKRSVVGFEGLDDSEIETRIVQLNSNLLGVCFFHHLPSFELIWNLESRSMTVRRVS